MDNAERAARAGAAFKQSSHYQQNNDEITNLYDFVCDLLHYADTISDPDAAEIEGPAGDFVLQMADYHYQAEKREED